MRRVGRMPIKRTHMWGCFRNRSEYNMERRSTRAGKGESKQNQS